MDRLIAGLLLALLFAAMGPVVYYAFQIRKLVDSRAAVGIYARHYSDFISVIDTSHPDCPADVARRYKDLSRKRLAWAGAVLAVFTLMGFTWNLLFR